MFSAQKAEVQRTLLLTSRNRLLMSRNKLLTSNKRLQRTAVVS